MLDKAPQDRWGRTYFSKKLSHAQQMKLINSDEGFKIERFIASASYIHPDALDLLLSQNSKKVSFLLSVRMGDMNFPAEVEKAIMGYSVEVLSHGAKFASTREAREAVFEFIKNPPPVGLDTLKDDYTLVRSFHNLAENPALTLEELRELLELVEVQYRPHLGRVKMTVAQHTRHQEVAAELSYDKHSLVSSYLLANRNVSPTPAWCVGWFWRAWTAARLDAFFLEYGVDPTLWRAMIPHWEGSMRELLESAETLSADKS